MSYSHEKYFSNKGENILKIDSKLPKKLLRNQDIWPLSAENYQNKKEPKTKILTYFSLESAYFENNTNIRIYEKHMGSSA